jgi:hypothetical protein
MAWTTPPTFVDASPASAAQLNILSDDLEFLQGVAAGPNAPFQSVVHTNSGNTTYHLRYRYRYLHYKYVISTDPGDDVKIRVNGTISYSDGVASMGTYSGYVDLNSLGLTAGSWYPVIFEWQKTVNSVCTLWYIVTANVTAL